MKKVILVLIIGLLLTGCLPMFTDSENIKHFSNSMGFSNQASQIINQWEGGISEIDYSDIEKILNFNKQALSEALQVDIGSLNKDYENFGTYYKAYFIEGTKLYIEGTEENNNLESIEGQMLLDKWGDWYSENVDKIRKK